MNSFLNTYREFNAKIKNFVCEAKQRKYPNHPNEKLLHSIWFGKHFIDKNLKTLDGKQVEIIYRGEYSVDGGPDFKNTILKIDNITLKGDVEIHLNLSDWDKHKHKYDEKYENVILHVALNKDTEKIFASGYNSKRIPQIVLEDKLLKDLSELMSELDEESHPAMKFGGFGRCFDLISSNVQTADKYLKYIDIAGDERILIKAEGLQKRVERFGFKETFYQGLLESLGYAFNKSQMLELSLAIPFSHIMNLVKNYENSMERLIVLQSIFFKTAELIPQKDSLDDEESIEYISKLERYSKQLGIKARNIKWNAGGNRPQNSVYRRIAAATHLFNSHLLNNLDDKIYSIFSKNSDRLNYDKDLFNIVRQSIQSFFLDCNDSYWSYRTKFGPPSFSRGISLIGKNWIDIFVVNIIIPYVLVKSRMQKDSRTESFLHYFYSTHPPLMENHITRYMKARTVGEVKKMKNAVIGSINYKNFNTAKRQMGLIQIYFDDCLKGVEGCESCGLPSWLNS